MLKLDNVCITFHGGTVNEKKALQDIHLDIKKGEFITVIGSNGAGKSTLLNVIAGTLEIDKGSIVLDGNDITKLKEHQRAGDIGRLFQDPLKGTAPNMTLEENLSLAYGRGVKKASLYQKYLKLGRTKEEKELFVNYVKKLDLGLETRMTNKVGLLSGGQRQALTLTMATMNPPKLLLLDEHTAALDPKTAKQVMHITKEIIEENHMTCIMITHNIEHALQYGDRMLVMAEGRIIKEIEKEEKQVMTIEDVLKVYAKANVKQLSDSMILG
ncbi:ABC transporter ATP-binding protein [Tannockella kyphosi]|uniref:ABC transporter ATP-binding protein n=1 Tax=Tannockella kyphosi TaxID=2899121 RepID=UPI00201151B0|nr:ATP-binding cassette domain-containing protein [Tannockella kyphosi]